MIGNRPGSRPGHPQRCNINAQTGVVTRRYVVVVKADSIKAVDEALEMGLADFTIETYNVVTEDEVVVATDCEEHELDPEILMMRKRVKAHDSLVKIASAYRNFLKTYASTEGEVRTYEHINNTLNELA